MAFCAVSGPLPNPPTTRPSCAVPIGGSNSTRLDNCCNSHINAIRTYADDCYQYCEVDNAADVQMCLDRDLGPYDANKPTFQCFNVVENQAVGGAHGRLRTPGIWAVVVLGISLASGLLSVL
ncbi:hypothetical protein BDV95DRAFT_505465 [Massariosphaeria phaeospora]|uniref:Uncharacterized protein n=1 Tax=Massariosphaeria phaeospora TaxID=100035 RepID=A0A7C8M7Y3_9PLEO|nr:hypothetical protein BDV95DRAFT_505465 [Massariosphaeria phaeospora]